MTDLKSLKQFNFCKRSKPIVAEALILRVMNANSTAVSEAMFAQLRRVLSLGILSPTPTTSAVSGNVNVNMNGFWSGSAGAATTELGSHSQTQHLSPIVSMSLAPSDLNKEQTGDLNNSREATERAAAGQAVPAAVAPDTVAKGGATELSPLSQIGVTEQKVAPTAATNETQETPTLMLTAGVITPPSQQVSPDQQETAQPTGTAGDVAPVGQSLLSPTAPENSAQPSGDREGAEENAAPVVVGVTGQDASPTGEKAVQQTTATATVSEERQLLQQQTTQGASETLNPGAVQPNAQSLQPQPPQVVLSAAAASDAPAFRVPRNSFVVSSGAAASATIPTNSGT